MSEESPVASPTPTTYKKKQWRPPGSKPGGERRGRKKGSPDKVGGRKAGTPNKFSKDVKEMILGALSDLGGRAWLVKQANAHPEAFMTLLGKVLPKNITTPEREYPKVLQIEFVDVRPAPAPQLRTVNGNGNANGHCNGLPALEHDDDSAEMPPLEFVDAPKDAAN